MTGFAAEDFHIFYMHAQATKDMTPRDVTQKIQEALLVASPDVNDRITHRIAALNATEQAVRGVYDYVTNRVRGEKALGCLKACWGGVFVQSCKAKKSIQECCFELRPTKSAHSVAILYANRERTELSDVYYMKPRWLPLLEGFVYLSHIREFCRMDPLLHTESTLLHSLNACALAMRVLADQLSQSYLM